jgi:hypothetical protein
LKLEIIEYYLGVIDIMQSFDGELLLEITKYSEFEFEMDYDC